MIQNNKELFAKIKHFSFKNSNIKEFAKTHSILAQLKKQNSNEV